MCRSFAQAVQALSEPSVNRPLPHNSRLRPTADGAVTSPDVHAQAVQYMTSQSQEVHRSRAPDLSFAGASRGHAAAAEGGEAGQKAVLAVSGPMVRPNSVCTSNRLLTTVQGYATITVAQVAPDDGEVAMESQSHRAPPRKLGLQSGVAELSDALPVLVASFDWWMARSWHHTWFGGASSE